MTSNNEAADSAPIDMQSLQTRCLGDLAFVSELIGIFKDQSASTLIQLRQSVENGDRAGVTRWAHALKGTAVNLSADRLGAMCCDLERIAATISEAETQDRMNRISAELDRCVAFFGTVLADLE